MQTCCTAEEILSTRKTFQVAANEFRSGLVVFEQLLTLFRGEKVNEYMQSMRKIEECAVNQQKYGGDSNTTYEAFELLIFKTKEHMYELLNGLKRYLNHQILDYSNVICSACNPLESSYVYKSEEGVWSVQMNMANCSNFLDFFEYELEVIRVLQKYMYALTNFLKCDTENPIELEELDTTFLDENLTQFNTCFNDFGLENPECKELCNKRNIMSYKFPGNFFLVIKQLFTIWVGRLTEIEAPDYYKKVMQKEWVVADLPKLRFFPTKEETQSEMEIENLQYEWIERGGLSLTNDYMSKLYTHAGSTYAFDE